jgi:4-hydroxy-tetrahydrodipicolinate synthase
MQTDHPVPNGLWLPLITPFRDGELDEKSLRRLVQHYAAQPIDGLVLGATTGEGLTLDDDEVERLVMVTAAETARARKQIPIYVGLAGSNTRRGVAELARTAAWPITRPSQQGLYRHFSTLADNTTRPILLYNIPYRTGINLSNEVTLQLAEHPNIVGLKDCCADPIQSFELLRSRPARFAVLSGEDTLFHSAIMQGADGGILAAAHVETAGFAFVRERLLAGDQSGALAAWHRLFDLARLLFAEPNPAPIKHWLWRAGLIDSPEVRLPMTPVSDTLAARIGLMLAQTSRAAACA